MPRSTNAEYYDTINRYTGDGTEANEPGGMSKSIGFGVAERPHISGTKPCMSRTGCKLLGGRKLLAEDGTCGLCGGKVAKR